ncbi:MAG: DnaJ C-terminal domain-containing protein [Candidatus Hodarchaeales archaeon]
MYSRTVKDYYSILGVDKNASTKDIKKRYRHLAKKWHPDAAAKRGIDRQVAEEKFKDINEAFSVLSNEEMRKQYDNGGSAGFDFGNFDFSTIDFSNFDIGGQGFGGFGNLDDLFSGIFNRSHGHKTRVSRGADLQMEVHLTLEEAAFGTSKIINIPGAGESLNGGEKIRIKVRPGTDDNHKLRLKGKGRAGLNGGPSGDLYIVFRIDEHPQFVKEGKNLIYDLPIGFGTAVLGGKKTVPLLGGGKASITIPAGTQTHTKFRIKGKGFNGGDLFVRVILQTPTSLTEEQKAVLESMR